ncbi:uncharacterized protein BX663DRAFT_524970 [Cokeromyces recurvatus]|uniref:uncharacterized protein n=1 Tax=Cokeromyces recurvatus TaxID=90255 RepID=UPI002220B341|nr:uncharacterized protein BX663DRAFT_524970 [Cokeromyces recurvatus]KAI7898496.1 hypothetical protein BX663DRAFT_524970 [Cokeromyces recurvatus]
MGRNVKRIKHQVYGQLCFFINESGFYTNLKETQGEILKREAIKVKVSITRVNSISIMGSHYQLKA